MESTGSVARIEDYGYSAPSEGEVVASLTRVFGPDRGADIWARACGIAFLSVGQVRTLLQLERCANALAVEGGAAATVARSVEIRLRTYNRLAARHAAASRPGAST